MLTPWAIFCSNHCTHSLEQNVKCHTWAISLLRFFLLSFLNRFSFKFYFRSRHLLFSTLRSRGKWKNCSRWISSTSRGKKSISKWNGKSRDFEAEHSNAINLSNLVGYLRPVCCQMPHLSRLNSSLKHRSHRDLYQWRLGSDLYKMKYQSIKLEIQKLTVDAQEWLTMDTALSLFPRNQKQKIIKCTVQL